MFNTNFRPPCLFGNNWKSLETRKRFFKSVFQPWSTTPTECQRLVSFSWTRTRTILRIARLLVSRRDATPCVTRLPSPPLPTEDGEMRKDLRHAAVLLYTFTDGLLMLGTDSGTFSRLFTHTFFAQISTRQCDVTVLLAPPGSARDPNRKCNYKTDVYVTFWGICYIGFLYSVDT